MAKAMILPELALSEWADTQTTLHRWAQIVGKTRLEFAPMQNHWWQVVLYVSSRGLTTSPIPYEGRTFEVAFDFTNHELVIVTSDGETRTMPLRARSVADFYDEYLTTLQSVGVSAKLWPVPVEMADTLRFTNDHTHHAYDPDAAHRAWQIIVFADGVLKDFRGRFIGKCSPSHFWWGGFDLACTRFSGKPAPPHPGGIPNLADYVTRESYSYECISAGWWPGNVGGPVAEAAFYAYSYPEPPGCDAAPIEPDGAYYHPQLREWILPYEAVRNMADPARALMHFLDSTYGAAAALAKWDRGKLERGPDWVTPPSAAH
jgi:hypothetical protein